MICRYFLPVCELLGLSTPFLGLGSWLSGLTYVKQVVGHQVVFPDHVSFLDRVLYFFLLNLIYFMDTSASCVCHAHGGWKNVLDSLELELQRALSRHTDTGGWIRVLWTAEASLQSLVEYLLHRSFILEEVYWIFLLVIWDPGVKSRFTKMFLSSFSSDVWDFDPLKNLKKISFLHILCMYMYIREWSCAKLIRGT